MSHFRFNLSTVVISFHDKRILACLMWHMPTFGVVGKISLHFWVNQKSFLMKCWYQNTISGELERVWEQRNSNLLNVFFLISRFNALIIVRLEVFLCENKLPNFNPHDQFLDPPLHEARFHRIDTSFRANLQNMRYERTKPFYPKVRIQATRSDRYKLLQHCVVY